MKRFFNGKLYLEGLKQLRLVGFLSLAVLELITVLLLINTNSMIEHLTDVFHMTFVTFNPSLLGTFTVVAPLMTLNLFSFLNKRNTSDFYHALPTTRASLFISFFLAIVTWLIGLFAVTTVTATILVVPMADHMSIDVLNIVLSTANLFAASLFITAAVAIAMTITGTIFTNVVVALMLIFVPRILMTVISMSVVEFVPIIPNNTVLPPLGTMYNIPFGVMFSLLDGALDETLAFWPGGLYTLGVALVYTVIACVLFIRRKSESAGQAAPNRVLQAVYRLTLATAVCLVPCWFIIAAWVCGDPWYTDNVLLLVDFYAIAVLVYFAYELITTRKWKNLLKAIPSLGFLVLINVGIIATAVGICRYNLQITPTADQITSVAILNTEDGYLSQKTTEVEIKDNAVKQTLSAALADTVDLIQNGGTTKYYQSDLNRVRVRFRTRTGTYDRYILISASQQAQLMDALQSQEAFRDMYMNLPKPSKNTLTPTTYRLSFWDGNEPIVSDKLHEVLQQEINEIGFEKWYAYCNSETIYYDDELYAKENGEYVPWFNVELLIDTYVGAQQCTWSIQLNGLLPQTSQIAIDMVNERADIDKAIDLMCSEEATQGDVNGWFETYLYYVETDDAIHTYQNSFSTTELNEDARTALREWLQADADKPVDVTKPFASISLYYYDYDNEEETYITFCVPIAESGELPAFFKIDQADSVYKY